MSGRDSRLGSGNGNRAKSGTGLRIPKGSRAFSHDARPVPSSDESGVPLGSPSLSAPPCSQTFPAWSSSTQCWRAPTRPARAAFWRSKMRSFWPWRFTLSTALPWTRTILPFWRKSSPALCPSLRKRVLGASATPSPGLHGPKRSPLRHPPVPRHLVSPLPVAPDSSAW